MSRVSTRFSFTLIIKKKSLLKNSILLRLFSKKQFKHNINKSKNSTIMKVKLIIFCLIQSFNSIQAQTNICFVEYINYSDIEHNNLQWFDEEKVIYQAKRTFIWNKPFPVYNNSGVSRSETDTVKYKIEYYQFLNNYRKSISKFPMPVNQRFYTSNVLKRSNMLDDSNYVVVDTLAKMSDWEILDDTINLLGFNCQKAVTYFRGTKFTAYFTTKFLYNAGPKNFRGLPGLILKVSNDNKTLGFEAITITYPFKKRIPFLNEEGREVSQQEFTKLVDESNGRVYKSLENLKNMIPQKPKEN
jgi:GLPGLI family protein